MEPHEDRREAFLREAGRAYDKLAAPPPRGSAERFDDIEERAEGAGRGLGRELMAARLAAEECATPHHVACPRCGRPMRRPEAAERNLDTFSGTVHYKRSHAICDRCGFSFSPGGDPAGHPSPRRVEPPHPESL